MMSPVFNAFSRVCSIVFPTNQAMAPVAIAIAATQMILSFMILIFEFEKNFFYRVSRPD